MSAEYGIEIIASGWWLLAFAMLLASLVLFIYHRGFVSGCERVRKRIRFGKAIDALPGRQPVIFTLHIENRLSYRQIARLLEMDAEEVLRELRRAHATIHREHPEFSDGGLWVRIVTSLQALGVIVRATIDAIVERNRKE